MSPRCWMLPRSIVAVAVAAAGSGAAQPAAEQPPGADPHAPAAEPAEERAAEPPAEPASAGDEAPPTPEAKPEARSAPAPAAAGPAAPPAARPVPGPLPPGPLGSAEPAPAVEPAPEEVEEPMPTGDQPLGSYQEHVQVQFGVRTSYITDEGYGLFERTVDPIGDNYPALQTSLGGGVALLPMGSLSLAVLGLWEYGGAGSNLRGESTDLDFHRLSLGVELRNHFAPWMYALLRVGPAAVDVRASLEESTTQRTLYSRDWCFGLDASAGVAFQLYGKRSGASRTPRLWAVAEGGYGWTGAVDLRFAPEDDDDTAPQRMEALDLGSLAIRGPMFRVSAAVTF